jgi:biopolymer transport protein ExbD
MRIRRATEPGGSLIDITPLVDMMFTLVLFFLVTTSFTEDERDIQVNLPDAVEGKTLSDAAPLITVNVRQDGSYFLLDRQMDLAQLRLAVADAIKTKPDQKVLIRGDKLALHGHVAAAVLACKNSGVHQANIGYQLEPATTGN